MYRYPRTPFSTKKKGTAQDLGYKYAIQGYKVGIMVASNSGRPAGSCGNGKSVQKIHSEHKTQEEDLISCWMHATHPYNQTHQDALFARTIAQQWGLKRPSGGPNDFETIQRVDYVHTTNPHDFARPCFVVHDAPMCAKGPSGFNTSKRFSASLVFVAGPNASSDGSSNGSMRRTANLRAKTDYGFFRDCIKHALRAGLREMRRHGIQIALMARLSCGIYSGPHKERVNIDFMTILDEVLIEQDNDGQPLRNAFIEVIVPDVSKSTTDRKQTGTCSYGTACHRTNPDHIITMHPPGWRPQPKPARGHTQQTSVCPYGDHCYNTDHKHIVTMHPPGWTPVLKPTKKHSPCRYGNHCYRTDPEHRKERPRGWNPVPKSERKTHHPTHGNSGCELGRKCSCNNPEHVRLCHDFEHIPRQPHGGLCDGCGLDCHNRQIFGGVQARPLQLPVFGVLHEVPFFNLR